MCALLWQVMTWCHHYQITVKARHIPGCLNVMADLLSRSNQVQSTEWSLHPQVFKQICQKWFTPHVDLFAIRLNHKLPLYVSPVPDPNTWDTDALNINWMGLTAYAYLPTALLHRVIQKIRQCNCLIIVIAPGWPGMPWFWDLGVSGPGALNRDPTSATSVNNTPQTVPQLSVPQQSTSQPPRLVSRSGHFLQQGFSVQVAERLLLLRDHQQEPYTDFFMYLYQDLNRHPSTTDGYRTAIVDTLGPAGHLISQTSYFHRLLSSFHRDRPKSSRNIPKWNLSMTSQKHPLSL